jgi:hypothetical protein
MEKAQVKPSLTEGSKISTSYSEEGKSLLATSIDKLTLPEPETVILKQQSMEQYLSDYAEILYIETRGQDQRPQVVFSPNEGVRIRITAAIHHPIPVCGFSLSIYTLSGIVVANLFWPFQNGLSVGEPIWEVYLQNPNLRQGEYIISCGVIREFLTTSNENVVFYCRWSRAISFRIDENYIGNMPLGLVHMNTDPPPGTVLLPDKTIKV